MSSFRASIPAALFAAWSSGACPADESAAVREVTTGITSVGPGVIIISVAVALLLTLLLRQSFSRVAWLLTRRLGKRRICRILEERSPAVLSDFIIPGAYGGLTRIDHAILTSGGILCIQTKHYNGVVFGNADEPQWTSVHGIRRRKFLNPLIQNEGRAKALRRIVPDVPVANLVVFTGAVQLTSPPDKNVIHVRDLKSYIAKFVFGPCKIDDWDAVLLTVKSAALTDEKSRRDFRAQLSFS
ncbi:MAG: nuclease-related domain-containing protein [Woeseiaceae bacterium]